MAAHRRWAGPLIVAWMMLRPASSLCLFTQHSGGTPEPANFSLPFPANFSAPMQCPEYAASGCCNSYQNTILEEQLQTADSFFGIIASGGCPACSQNLRRFWCAYTCSPKQDQFVRITSYVPGKSLDTLMYSEPGYACSIFSSCSGTSLARTFTTMSTCEGFFAYQAQAAVIFGVNVRVAFADPVNVTRNSSTPGDDIIPSVGSYLNCCSFPSNASNPAAGNTSCPCATCKGMCGIVPCHDGVTPGGPNGSGIPSVLPNLGDPDMSVLYGVNTLALGVFYGAIGAVSIGVVGLRWRKRRLA